MTRLLFVCLGNICRSPAAEGVMRGLSGRHGLSLGLDSAGTSGWHVGDPPYTPMIQAAARRGHDLTALRARAFTADDFAAFDLILAMDRANLAAIQSLRPQGTPTIARLFIPETEVPDPYYTRDFDGVLALIEQGAASLLDQLATEQ